MTGRVRRLSGPVGMAVAALLLAAGCQGGGDRASSPTPSQRVTPLPGSVEVQGVNFVPPDGLTRAEKDELRHGNAAYEMVGDAKPPTPPPTLDVFVERGDVGPLKVRTTTVVNGLNLQAENVRFVENRRVRVPGAEAAQLIEVTYTCSTEDGEKKVTCRQLELIVQMPNAPQYNLRYGLTSGDYSKADFTALVSSVRVTR